MSDHKACHRDLGILHLSRFGSSYRKAYRKDPRILDAAYVESFVTSSILDSYRDEPTF
jgi:hypothetical protein